jgi:hypothetical protein
MRTRGVATHQRLEVRAAALLEGLDRDDLRAFVGELARELEPITPAAPVTR